MDLSGMKFYDQIAKGKILSFSCARVWRRGMINLLALSPKNVNYVCETCGLEALIALCKLF